MEAWVESLFIAKESEISTAELLHAVFGYGGMAKSLSVLEI
jgi:hypothetical protein